MKREEIAIRMKTLYPAQFPEDADALLEYVDAVCDILLEENGGAVPLMPDEFYRDTGEAKPV